MPAIDLAISDILKLPSQATLGIAENPLGGEQMAALGIDPVAMEVTPAGECVRINLYTEDDAPLSLALLLKFFGELGEKFPSFRRMVAVFEHRSEGVVIFLPTPRDADR